MSGTRPTPPKKIIQLPVMIDDVEIPQEVPVMTLSGAVLFPQAMMPLFIFEPRYKTMLTDVLANDRIFAVATLDERSEGSADSETPYSVAGIGVVRACKQNPDGSSNLVLQGLARVELESISDEAPYRKAQIRQILSEPGGSEDSIATSQSRLLSLIQTQRRLGAGIPKEVVQFLSNINEPENALDLAIYTLCSSATLKQELLETRGVLPRYKKFAAYLQSEIERLKLDIKLKGKLDDKNIGHN
ncbi:MULTISPECIES: LON peptidase substrate-binding domain-containing protein [unclassified Lentimonas]|uniref:LON peptidase substrate-binding domain-containing protein n=2 Tax=Lentimonas TaxID=417293 RepID=UPI00138A0BB3|nr:MULTISPECIES: LON peptidase substrate-binding domain-containing protein [unclassified Lentimonas]